MIGMRFIGLTLALGISIGGCVSQPQPPTPVGCGMDRNVVQRAPGIVRTFDTAPVRPRNDGECSRILQQAVLAYQEFEYREVIRCVEQILCHEQATREEMIMATTLAGASAYLLGDRLLAEGYFQEALGFDPTLRLNASIYPAAMLQFFYNIKKGGG